MSGTVAAASRASKADPNEGDLLEKSFKDDES